MLKPQHYWDDYPGSKAEIHNEFDGKVYHAHPLLEYKGNVNLANHTPLWKKKQLKEKETRSKARKSAEKNVNEYVFEEA